MIRKALPKAVGIGILYFCATYASSFFIALFAPLILILSFPLMGILPYPFLTLVSFLVIPALAIGVNLLYNECRHDSIGRRIDFSVADVHQPLSLLVVAAVWYPWKATTVSQSLLGDLERGLASRYFSAAGVYLLYILVKLVMLRRRAATSRKE